MTNLQIATVNMFLRVKQVFANFKTIFEGFKPLKTKMGAFDDKMDTLDADIKAQALGTGGVTESKETKRKDAIDAVVPLADKGYAWAEENNDVNNLDLFDVGKKDFLGDEIESAALMENILKALSNNVATLADYNITKATIANASTKVGSFKAAIGSPQVQASAVKVVTGDIVTDIKDLKKILKTTDKLIASEFKLSQPKAYKEYAEARVIGSVVATHTHVSFNVFSDAGHTQPVVGAVVKIDSIKREDTTDAAGVADIIKIQGGTYIATITATNFIDTTINFSIKRGEHKEIDVVMQGV